MGPVVSEEQLERVTGYIEIGRREGAEIVTGGERATDLGDGYFVQPTIFAGVSNDMRIAQEEIFGPVAAVIPVDDVDEAIRDRQRHDLRPCGCRLDERRLEGSQGRAGDQGGDGLGQHGRPSRPGGQLRWLQAKSGFGRELGVHSIETYTQTKTVWMSLK